MNEEYEDDGWMRNNTGEKVNIKIFLLIDPEDANFIPKYKCFTGIC